MVIKANAEEIRESPSIMFLTVMMSQNKITISKPFNAYRRAPDFMSVATQIL
jgi:hypothetical protein